VVHPSIPARSVNELVALAKAEPGKFSYASAGRGTPAHLAGELFKLAFAVDITHVPFNGGGPASQSILGGHVPIGVSALPTAVTYIRGGQLRALALFSSRRSSALPDVPTMMEASGHDLPADIVTGLMAPARRIARISSTERIPPPTVNGIKMRSATRLTISTTMSRRSDEAVISRKMSSSAPSRS